jgi:hypothetical protein
MANGEQTLYGTPAGVSASVIRDDFSISEELLTKYRAQPPAPPPKPNKAQMIFGILGDALQTMGQVRAGGTGGGQGPFISGLMRRQQQYQEKLAEFENQRQRGLETLLKIQEQTRYREAQQDRQAVQDSLREISATQRASIDLQKLENDKLRVEIAARNATTNEERFALQQQLADINTRLRESDLSLKTQLFDIKKEAHEVSMKAKTGLPKPPAQFRNQRHDLIQLMEAVRAARGLVAKDVGGPVAGRFSIGNVPVARLKTLFAEINTLIAPDRLGAVLPAGDRELIEGIIANEKSLKTSQVAALEHIERAFGGRLRRIEEEFDFGPGSGLGFPEPTRGPNDELVIP